MIKVLRENREILVFLYEVRKLNVLFAEKVGAELEKLVETNGVRLLFDLSGICFIDSTGFAMLKYIQEKANANSSEFILCNVPEEIMELINLLELRDYFSLCSRKINRKNLMEAGLIT